MDDDRGTTADDAWDRVTHYVYRHAIDGKRLHDEHGRDRLRAEEGAAGSRGHPAHAGSAGQAPGVIFDPYRWPSLFFLHELVKTASFTK